jgi:hypothetical protein
VILADTSVWVEHLRGRSARLGGLLEQGQIVSHPFVFGEIALGVLNNRIEILNLLAELPAVRIVPHEEAIALVDRRGLAGSGIGWVDVHLVASALVERVPLWTLDRRLGVVARELDAAWDG